MYAIGESRPVLELSPDQLLSSTRSVRLRLDLTRPVARSLIEECLDLAQQAPSGGNQQGWSFVVVTDPEKRRALGELYKQGWDAYLQSISARLTTDAPASMPGREVMRVYRSAQHLADHMGDVPVLVIPCIAGRTEEAGISGAGVPMGIDSSRRLELHAGRSCARSGHVLDDAASTS